MATLRELKGRIGSVASSEKITGAMKMISSAKMHKAEQSLVKLLPYRRQIRDIIGNLLSADAAFSSPLLEERVEIKRVALIVYGSDDGLCGAYNANIVKALVAAVKKYRNDYPVLETIEVVPVGGKMVKAVGKIAHKLGITVRYAEGVDTKTSGDGVKAFTWMMRDDFTGGHYDKVDLMYMHFKSISRQVLTHEQLLPVSQEGLAAGDGSVAPSFRPYIFEPDANTIFTTILPMYLLAIMQEVFTENRASEQAARVMAMQSANDNAKKLLEQLQLEYNKLRQDSITTELLDIVGGQVR